MIDPLTVEVHFNKAGPSSSPSWRPPGPAWCTSPWRSRRPADRHVGTGPFARLLRTGQVAQPGQEPRLLRAGPARRRRTRDRLYLRQHLASTPRRRRADLVQDLAKKDYMQLSAMPGVRRRLSENGSCNWAYIGMNCTKPPFDNPPCGRRLPSPRTGRAIADNVMFGLATPLTGGILPRWSWPTLTDQSSTPRHTGRREGQGAAGRSGIPGRLRDHHQGVSRVRRAGWRASR